MIALSLCNSYNIKVQVNTFWNQKGEIELGYRN